jgi:hypothetical protein
MRRDWLRASPSHRALRNIALLNILAFRCLRHVHPIEAEMKAEATCGTIAFP